ncbi:MAG: protein kinase [Planctomycetes bacterium]|nr:protein kinase [Planctomycetota bacterium]
MDLPGSVESILSSTLSLKEIHHLDSGGFKEVYRVKLSSGVVEILKAIRLPPIDNADVKKAYYAEAAGRARREISILGKCKSPELVKLGTIEPFETELSGTDCIVYSEEYLEGGDLLKEIRGNTEVPPEPELKCCFGSILKAIKELWSFGYVHRDIKPQNIMKLPDKKRPFVLLDLGISFSVRETALTYEPGIRLPLATYRYLAPEMMSADFRANLDYRSDLYSAALSVYEYAAKKHPIAIDNDDIMNTISRALRVAPAPLKTRRNDLSDEFCELTDQMLKKKPGLRPSNLSRLIQKMEKE